MNSVGAKAINWNPHKEFVTCSVRLASLAPQARWAFVQHPARGSRPALVRSLSVVDTPALLRDHIDFFHGVHASDLLPLPRSMLQHHRRRTSTSSFAATASSSSLSDLEVNPTDSLVQAAAYIAKNVTLSQVAYVLFTLSQPVQGGSVSVLSLKGLVSSGVASVIFENVGNTANSTVDAQVFFADGSSGSSVRYQGALYPGPMITPNVAKRLYSVPDHEYGSSAFGNKMSVAEFDGQYYSTADLQTFLQLVNYVPSQGVNVSVTVAGNGGNIEKLPGGESTLDVDWTLAIAPNVPLVFWSVGLGGFLVEWAQQVAADPNPPFVHSISYGVPEVDETADYTDRMDQELQKLGLRGITVMTTSGDIGVDDGQNCTQDTPDYPSSSQWGTSLGATALVRNTDMPVCSSLICDQMEEVPCAADLGSQFTTGGGFSFRYATPSYQLAAVQNYLKTAPDLPPSGWYNPNGRGYNDFAALGFRMMTVRYQKIELSGGTSASGPVACAIFALLNGHRLAAGMPTMGFANPWLYDTAAANPDAFHQVATATNKCEELGAFGVGECCEYGFTSTAAWNPLSGLGTPNYMVLKEAALQN